MVIKLEDYGNEFLSIHQCNDMFEHLAYGINDNTFLKIDFNNVVVVSPSVMTRLLNNLYDKGFSEIEVINANDQLKTTVNFAMHSIELSKKNHSLSL